MSSAGRVLDGSDDRTAAPRSYQGALRCGYGGVTCSTWRNA
ncbi:hypothetical protein [Amycolatopsis iheyensis]|nr:hypothetical protein [Amycolatopsis iheyensis]